MSNWGDIAERAYAYLTQDGTNGATIRAFLEELDHVYPDEKTTSRVKVRFHPHTGEWTNEDLVWLPHTDVDPATPRWSRSHKNGTFIDAKAVAPYSFNDIWRYVRFDIYKASVALVFHSHKMGREAALTPGKADSVLRTMRQGWYVGRVTFANSNSFNLRPV